MARRVTERNMNNKNEGLNEITNHKKDESMREYVSCRLISLSYRLRDFCNSKRMLGEFRDNGKQGVIQVESLFVNCLQTIIDIQFFSFFDEPSGKLRHNLFHCFFHQIY